MAFKPLIHPLSGKGTNLGCVPSPSVKIVFSVVLMALVDAEYKFLWIDVGSDDSNNDARIYNGSELKVGLESLSSIFSFPEDKALPSVGVLHSR